MTKFVGKSVAGASGNASGGADSGEASDLSLDGIGNASGGAYRNVKIDGVAGIEGDTTSAALRVNGVVTFRGNLRTGAVGCSGKLKVEGDLRFGEAELDGVLTVEGGLGGESLRLKGGLKVRGACELDSLVADGAFKVGGLLNVGRLDVRLRAAAEAREIGAETILVRRSGSGRLRDWLAPRLAADLKAELIEGDELDLEYTVAKRVSGNRVRLGRGCVIGEVEYRDELSVLPGAKIGKEMKLGG